MAERHDSLNRHDHINISPHQSQETVVAVESIEVQSKGKEAPETSDIHTDTEAEAAQTGQGHSTTLIVDNLPLELAAAGSIAEGPPDGGRDAWLNILGCWLLLFASFGFSKHALLISNMNETSL